MEHNVQTQSNRFLYQAITIRKRIGEAMKRTTTKPPCDLWTHLIIPIHTLTTSLPHVQIIILLISHLLKNLCNLKRRICFLNLKTFPEVKKKIRYVFNQFVSLKKQTPHVLEVGSPTYELFRPFCQLLSRIVLHSYSFGIKLPIPSCHLICLHIVVLIYINYYT